MNVLSFFYNKGKNNTMKTNLFIILLNSLSFASVTLTLDSLSTQNEYFTTTSGTQYLWSQLEVGISTDENIAYVGMGVSHYNNMGLGTPYGGLVEEHEFTMTTLSGATIYGHHNMFPQDHYIPAGTTDEVLMYIPILISLENDDQFCIQYPDFRDLDGNSVTVNINEESCISMDDLTGLDSNETNLDTLTILIVDSETGYGIEGAGGFVSSYSENDWYGGELFDFITNDSGYAFIEGFPNGFGTISVSSEEHYPVNYQEFVFTGTEQLAITMIPYGFAVGDADTLEIQFIDSNTGEGVAGVMVDIYPEFIDWGDDCWNNECFISVETDSSGSAIIRDFPLGFGWIEASKIGYYNLFTQYTFDGTQQLEFIMEPHDDFSGETDRLVFQFVDSYTGEGISGVYGSIWSYGENGNYWGEEIVFPINSNDNGYCVIENFPVGYHGHGETFADGYLPGYVQFEFFGDDTITVGMTNLGSSATVTGTIDFENESNTFLLPFVFAIPMSDSLNSGISPAVMVDGFGNYELSLSPGDYKIGALQFDSPTGYYWYDDSSGEMGFQMQFFENSTTIEGATILQVVESDEIGNINFDFINGQIFGFNGQMGNMVMGQVTSDNNTNMENTIVSVLDYNGQLISEQTVGNDQNFTLTGLSQNEAYFLSASHSEYGTVEKPFTVSNMVELESIEFSLSEMSTEEDLTQLPKQFSVGQNYPNPFNPTTTLEYTLPENMAVQITIFDNLGRVVKNLFNGNQGVGNKKVVWDATDNNGQPVSAGVYLYSIVADQNRQTKKMILLK